MFEKNKRKRLDKRERLDSKIAEIINTQKEIKSNLQCPCCKGKSFSEGWKGLKTCTLSSTTLFATNRFGEHVLPIRFCICETCGFVMNFVSFSEIPYRYFDDNLSKDNPNNKQELQASIDIDIRTKTKKQV